MSKVWQDYFNYSNYFNLLTNFIYFSFVAAHGRLPAPWSQSDADTFLSLAKTMFPDKVSHVKSFKECGRNCSVVKGTKKFL